MHSALDAIRIQRPHDARARPSSCHVDFDDTIKNIHTVQKKCSGRLQQQVAEVGCQGNEEDLYWPLSKADGFALSKQEASEAHLFNSCELDESIASLVGRVASDSDLSNLQGTPPTCSYVRT